MGDAGCDHLFGGSLGSSQLDATANVPGTFVYAPPAGTVLPVGNGQTLSVTFTPTDTLDYQTAAASTTINVKSGAARGCPIWWLRISWRASACNVVMTLTIANNGGTSGKQSVKLTAAKIGLASGTPLPQTVGTINAGGQAQVTVTFPGSAGITGAGSSLSVSGTYTPGRHVRLLQARGSVLHLEESKERNTRNETSEKKCIDRGSHLWRWYSPDRSKRARATSQSHSTIRSRSPLRAMN